MTTNVTIQSRNAKRVKVKRILHFLCGTNEWPFIKYKGRYIQAKDTMYGDWIAHDPRIW